MENATHEDTEVKKKGFGGKFYNFIACGGFILILLALVAIAVFVGYLVKCKS
jgi:hypothetical protein